jgi:hypothetical protein
MVLPATHNPPADCVLQLTFTVAQCNCLHCQLPQHRSHSQRAQLHLLTLSSLRPCSQHLEGQGLYCGSRFTLQQLDRLSGIVQAQACAEVCGTLLQDCLQGWRELRRGPACCYVVQQVRDSTGACQESAGCVVTAKKVDLRTAGRVEVWVGAAASISRCSTHSQETYAYTCMQVQKKVERPKHAATHHCLFCMLLLR